MKLEKYRDLKRFARHQNHENLYALAKQQEEKMLDMLEDEYDVMRGGRT